MKRVTEILETMLAFWLIVAFVGLFGFVAYKLVTSGSWVFAFLGLGVILAFLVTAAEMLND